MGIFDGIGTAIIGGLFGMKGQEAANAQTAASTQAQIDFQREMSITQHQREVADLQAAGLNPAYGMSSGGNAVPSGASYVAKNTLEPVSTALMANAQIQNLQASARKTNAEANITETMGMQQAKANFDSTVAKIGLTAQQANLAGTQTDKAIAEIMTERQRPAQVEQLVKLARAQENESLMRTMTEAQRREFLIAQTRYVASQTQLSAADVDAMQASDNLGRLVREYGPAANIVLDVLKTIRSVIPKR